MDVKRRSEQVIDVVSQGGVLYAGHDDRARERTKGIVDTFREFLKNLF
jgi:hypothetical protein